ncbi:MAG TPA: DUF1697 domain-containing protein [Candidatus Limiplasma sp.]|nr:DUF1697 domain-containing protein [Candidatus Limiplasma sp.]HPS80279.1 DUF1697 domain-containing protein [Candidatus Limiplasma sp.]
MRWIILLRGVNVGHTKRIRMADLANMLAAIGCTDIRTYLQSGNAVVDTELSEAELCEKLKTALAETVGFECGVVVRNSADMRRVAEELPFGAEAISQAETADPDVEHLHVYFLASAPDRKALEVLARDAEAGDVFKTGARELYLLSLRSVRLSKTAIRIAKLFPDATARNWRTVTQLAVMGSEPDPDSTKRMPL